jgi:hypothetical protein
VRPVSVTAYVAMLIATNVGWIIGTLLYHSVVTCR